MSWLDVINTMSEQKEERMKAYINTLSQCYCLTGSLAAGKPKSFGIEIDYSTMEDEKFNSSLMEKCSNLGSLEEVIDTLVPLLEKKFKNFNLFDCIDPTDPTHIAVCVGTTMEPILHLHIISVYNKMLTIAINIEDIKTRDHVNSRRTYEVGTNREVYRFENVELYKLIFMTSDEETCSE